jgi:hypothetical protein
MASTSRFCCAAGKWENMEASTSQAVCAGHVTRTPYRGWMSRILDTAPSRIWNWKQVCAHACGAGHRQQAMQGEG